MAGYTADDFVTQLSDGAAVVLPYVGAAVGAGLLLFAIFVGIRSAFRILADVIRDIQDRDGYRRYSGTDENGFTDSNRPANDGEADYWAAEQAWLDDQKSQGF
jgi:hypothetical protein